MKYTKHDFLSKVWVRPPGWTWYSMWGQKAKLQLFQNIVMLHIKLTGIRYAATW